MELVNLAFLEGETQQDLKSLLYKKKLSQPLSHSNSLFLANGTPTAVVRCVPRKHRLGTPSLPHSPPEDVGALTTTKNTSPQPNPGCSSVEY